MQWSSPGRTTNVGNCCHNVKEEYQCVCTGTSYWMWISLRMIVNHIHRDKSTTYASVNLLERSDKMWRVAVCSQNCQRILSKRIVQHDTIRSMYDVCNFYNFSVSVSILTQLLERAVFFHHIYRSVKWRRRTPGFCLSFRCRTKSTICRFRLMHNLITSYYRLILLDEFHPYVLDEFIQCIR